MTPEVLGNVLQAAMLAAGRALSLDDFLSLLDGNPEAPDRRQLRDALAALGESLDGGPLELAEVASGYRLQVRKEYSPFLAGLFAERPPRYSRALLETLALIAYRQPITRGEIEDVRGVAVSSNIIKTLMEREWIRVLGHREVPGRPALFGTTHEFLDHFGLTSLEGLPALAEIRDLDQVEPDLFADVSAAAGSESPAEGNPADAGHGDAAPPETLSAPDSGSASGPDSAHDGELAQPEHGDVADERADAQTMGESGDDGEGGAVHEASPAAAPLQHGDTTAAAHDAAVDGQDGEERPAPGGADEQSPEPVAQEQPGAGHDASAAGGATPDAHAAHVSARDPDDEAAAADGDDADSLELGGNDADGTAPSSGVEPAEERREN